MKSYLARFGPDGRMYFGQGTATSSGVVGKDNFDLGWLQLATMVHDIPGKNITLTGDNFKSPNPLIRNESNSISKTIPGAYSPFGVLTHKGEIIRGDIKCSGCILSAKPDGTNLKLVACGLRHPYGITVDRDGKNLIIAMDAADERASPESRPVHLANDAIYKISIPRTTSASNSISTPSNSISTTSNSSSSTSSYQAKWYGWPDFFAMQSPLLLPNLILNGQRMVPFIFSCSIIPQYKNH